MSSAARDPLPADQLPPLLAAQVMITEAPPDPPPGPERDAVAADGAARVDRAVGLMDAAISAYVQRVQGVVEARMRGPKARKGTRWWATQVKTAWGGSVGTSTLPGVEVKSLDADYVLPQRTVDELGDAVRPVGLRIVADAASAVAKSLGRPNTGLAAFDWREINTAVDSVVQHMLAVGERHAQDIRKTILDADQTATDLDDAVDRVMEATKRGGRWLLLNGRTLATALAGDAALSAAKALGVTHCQWLSRRDQSVRVSHREVDGQERPVGKPFLVGGFPLKFPGDPSGLPESWPAVANCRCSLIFAHPAPERRKAMALAEQGTPAAARRVISDAAAPGRPVVLGAPELNSGMSIPVVRLPADTVGYRVLDQEIPVEPGQRISWPGELALALAPPTGGVVLTVVVSAGTFVGVAGGAIVFPAGAVMSIAAVSTGQIVVMPVAV